MTNTLRAYKLTRMKHPLITVDDANEKNSRWTLRWPPPRDKQIAEIDVESGKIISYKRADGTRVIDCDPIDWVSVIDRRINYLWSKFSKEGASQL